MRKNDVTKWLRTRNGKIASVFTAVALGLSAYDLWPEDNGPTVPLNQVMNAVSGGKISRVTVRGNTIIAHDKNGGLFNANPVTGSAHLAVMDIRKLDKDLPVRAEEPREPYLKKIWTEIAPVIVPAVIFIPAIILAMVLGQRFTSRSAGKNKKKFTNERPAQTLADVIGQDEAKADMKDIVDFLKSPAKFKKMGSVIPRGTLLVGPPGTGKTLLAKALAGEAKVPFLSISGSDFVEMYVGLGAARVRDMFDQARKLGPCIIFIDEIDAVGRARSSGSHPGTQEQEQTLNQLLVEMDGFDGNSEVIIIAATNRPEMLDAALMRPGRFTRHAYVDLPNEADREKILSYYIEKKKRETKNPDLFDNTIDLNAISRLARGAAGADLANIINEATLYCGRRGIPQISQQILLKAQEDIALGPEKRNTSHSAALKDRVEKHEAGHAILGHFMHLQHGTSRPEKATVIPRTKSLGHVLSLPDEGLATTAKLKANLAMYAAGRVAEEIFYGGFENVSVGASGDIDQMTVTAHAMVTQYGMGAQTGMVNYVRLFNQGNYCGSEETNTMIDNAVRALCDDAHAEAKRVLLDNKEAWLRLADTLHDHETLGADEIADVINGNPIRAAKPVIGVLSVQPPALRVA